MIDVSRARPPRYRWRRRYAGKYALEVQYIADDRYREAGYTVERGSVYGWLVFRARHGVQAQHATMQAAKADALERARAEGASS